MTAVNWNLICLAHCVKIKATVELIETQTSWMFLCFYLYTFLIWSKFLETLVHVLFFFTSFILMYISPVLAMKLCDNCNLFIYLLSIYYLIFKFCPTFFKLA